MYETLVRNIKDFNEKAFTKDIRSSYQSAAIFNDTEKGFESIVIVNNLLNKHASLKKQSKNQERL